MSEFPFQETLVLLLTDAGIRQAVLSGDSRTLSELGLPLEHIQRLRSMDASRLEIFAEMVIAQRLTDITQILPLTAQLLGNRLHPIVRELNQEIKPSYSTKHDQALAFARFLSKQFRAQPPTPVYLEDILAYEMTSLELFGKRNEIRDVQIDLVQQLYQTESAPKIVPYRLSAHKVVLLNYDILEIAKELKEDRIPTPPPKRPMLVLLRVNPSGLIEKDEINSMTLAFIEACDNETLLSQIIENLAKNFDQNTPALLSNFRQKCSSLCQSLVERLVIGLRLSP